MVERGEVRGGANRSSPTELLRLDEEVLALEPQRRWHSRTRFETGALDFEKTEGPLFMRKRTVVS